MGLLMCSICLIAFSFNLNAFIISERENKMAPDSTITIQSDQQNNNSMPDSILNKYPFKNQNYFNKYFPGVEAYYQDFYIRGSENFETGFYLDGTKINDILTGGYSFFINPKVFDRIDFYNGYLPAEYGNISAGLFDYRLRTGGDKLSFEIEHLNDNITLTSDPYSGNKRLGAYYYGHNETNISIGGPAFIPELRFFTNVNYLFQRDKNPQRYPGVDEVFYSGSPHNQSVKINLPAGIVPLNSLESFNAVSTLLAQIGNIKMKASGIYFDENSYTERNHFFDYLNPRTGIIDKSGVLLKLLFDHKIGESTSYSISANYSLIKEQTSDPYLGNNYWIYGDSLANANVGIFWERPDSLYGRYRLPMRYRGYLSGFTDLYFPGVDHKKTEQSNLSFKGIFNFSIADHKVRIGADLSLPSFKYWFIDRQYRLAYLLDLYLSDSSYLGYSENEIKKIILEQHGVTNIGYDKLGNEVVSERDQSPKPVYAGLFLEDYFTLFNNLYFNLGLRYELFNSDQKTISSPLHPEQIINFQTEEVIEGGFDKTKTYNYFSPRIGIRYLLSENISVFTSYSQNVQDHQIGNLLQTNYTVIDSQNYYSVNCNFFKPIVTKQFEIGASYSPIINLNTSLVYFNKKSYNHQSFEYQARNQSIGFEEIFYTASNGTLSAKGIEFTSAYWSDEWYIKSNLTYQSIEETINKLPAKSFRSIWSTPILLTSTIESPRSNDFSLNFLIEYDFSSLSDVTNIFEKLKISTFYDYRSGRPFTLEHDNPRYIPYTPVPKYTPSTSQVDLKIEKGFIISGTFDLSVYLYVINLFDTENIYTLFKTSGSAYSDGLDLTREAEIFGNQVIQMHQLTNAYNPDEGQQTFFGPPRQIGFGIKLNY